MDQQQKPIDSFWHKLAAFFAGPPQAQGFDKLQPNPKPQLDPNQVQTFQNAFRKKTGY